MPLFAVMYVVYLGNVFRKQKRLCVPIYVCSSLDVDTRVLVPSKLFGDVKKCVVRFSVEGCALTKST